MPAPAFLSAVRQRRRWIRRSRSAETKSVAPTVRLGDTEAVPLPYNDPYFGLLHSLYALQHDIQRSPTAAETVHAFVGARVLKTVDQLLLELEIRFTTEQVTTGQDPEADPVIRDLRTAREHLQHVGSAVMAADGRLYDCDDERGPVDLAP